MDELSDKARISSVQSRMGSPAIDAVRANGSLGGVRGRPLKNVRKELGNIIRIPNSRQELTLILHKHTDDVPPRNRLEQKPTEF